MYAFSWLQMVLEQYLRGLLAHLLLQSHALYDRLLGCIAVYIVVSAMNSTQVSRQQHWQPWASRAFARSVSAHVA